MISINHITGLVPGLSQGYFLIPFLMIMTFFITVSMILTALIFISRFYSQFNRLRKGRTMRKFEGLLTAILTHVENNDLKLTGFGANQLVSSLRIDNLFSEIHKQYILDEIINYLRNVKGNYREILLAFYYQLRLQELSLRKIRSGKKQKIIRGVREFGEVNLLMSWNDIIFLMQKNDADIREELMYTLAKQSPEKLLHYLEHRYHYFSKWDEITIHAAFRKIDPEKLPLFKKWFHSKNRTLALFCIRMTGEFQQIESFTEIPDLLSRTGHSDKILAALDTIDKLNASDLTNELLHTLFLWIRHEEVVYRILVLLEKLAPGTGVASDPQALRIVIRKIAHYPSYRVHNIIDHFIEKYLDQSTGEKQYHTEMMKFIKSAS